MAQFPHNFRYNGITKELAWDGVEGAEEYEIQDQIEGSEEWLKTYLGPDKQCPFNKPPGAYLVKGRKVDSTGGFGIYGPPEPVIVA